MVIKYKNISLLEFVFVIICLFCITISQKSFMFTIICISSLLPIIIFKRQMMNSDIHIKKEKKFLHAFILVFIVYMGIQLYYKFAINLFNTMDQYTYNQLRLFQLPVTMIIFLGYIFRIRLRDFNWSITLRSLFVSMLVYIMLELVPFLIIKDVNTLKWIITIEYLKGFIQQVYYPSLVEEIIFRGFLLSGLLAYGMEKDKANINLLFMQLI